MNVHDSERIAGLLDEAGYARSRTARSRTMDGSLPVTDRRERDYFGLGRLDWRDAVDEPGGIEFNLPISSWLRLFDDIGFDVINYIEVRAPESATGTNGTVTADRAKRFPSEQVWHLRQR